MSAATEYTHTFTTIDRDTIARLYAMYGLLPIGGGSQENDEADAADEPDEEGDLPADLGDKGKAALADERKAKRDAQKALKAAQAENEALKAKQAETDAAKAAADEAEAIKRGEFEALATSRAETITTLTGERDGLKAQLDTLIAAIKPDVDAAWQAVPDEIKGFYDGADDDTLAKRAFLAKSKPAIDRLTAANDKKNEAFKRFPRTPQPNGNGDPTDAAMDQARRSGKYKV